MWFGCVGHSPTAPPPISPLHLSDTLHQKLISLSDYPNDTRVSAALDIIASIRPPLIKDTPLTLKPRPPRLHTQNPSWGHSSFCLFCHCLFSYDFSQVSPQTKQQTMKNGVLKACQRTTFWILMMKFTDVPLLLFHHNLSFTFTTSDLCNSSCDGNTTVDEG